jgi:hypothetical protein
MQLWFGAVHVVAQELLKKRRIGAKDAYILIDKAMKERDLIDSNKGGSGICLPDRNSASDCMQPGPVLATR